MKPTLLQRASSRPTGKAHHPFSTRRSVPAAAAVAFLAVLGLSRADAATYLAANETELIARITDANAYPDPDTIELVPNRVYVISQALHLDSPIIVNGNGATIDGGQISLGFIIRVGGEVSLNQLSITGLTNLSSAIPLFVGTGGMLTLNDSIVSGNASRPFLGGGLFVEGGATAILNNSAVSQNTATHSGGIHNAGTLTLNNSTVSGNTAGGAGGGIGNTGILVLNESAVHSNTANSGGGIYAALGSVSLNASSIHHNLAWDRVGRGGGGILTSASTLILNDRSSIHHNEAATSGGGISTAFMALGSTLELNGGSTISKNTAVSGGGIYDPDFSLTVTVNDGKIFKNTPDDFAP